MKLREPPGRRRDLPTRNSEEPKYVITEVEYSPQYLRNGGGQYTDGISFSAALDSIAGGRSTLASNVEADAGAITANICHITHGQPGSVCKYFTKAITSPDATPSEAGP